MARQAIQAAALAPLAAVLLAAAARPASADAVLEAAKAEAKGRAIFVIFGASW